MPLILAKMPNTQKSANVESTVEPETLNMSALSLDDPGTHSAYDNGAYPSPSQKSFRAALQSVKAMGGTLLLDIPDTKAFSHVRPGLQVDNSLVDGGGLGLFTSDDIEAGGFIGFFSGVFAWESDVDQIFKPTETCVQSYV